MKPAHFLSTTSPPEITPLPSLRRDSSSPEQNVDRFHLDDNFLGGLPMLNGDPLAVVSMFTDPSVVGAMGPQLIVDGVPSGSLDLPLSSIKNITVNQNPYSAEFE